MASRDVVQGESRLLARERGLLLVIGIRKGKGGHLGVSLGYRRTTLPVNILPHTRRPFLKQQGIGEERHARRPI